MKLLLAVCCIFLMGTTWIAGFPAEKRSKSSYYSNSYFDEMALSICGSISFYNPGYIFPVRRTCGSSQTCHQICTSPGLAKQAQWTSAPITCTESLHVYKSTPQLAPNPSGTHPDVGKIGLRMYRYHSCHHAGCGPNYCCCKK